MLFFKETVSHTAAMWDLIILQQQEEPLNSFAIAYFTVWMDYLLDTNSQSMHDF